jgi:NAD+ diphosphatase
MTSERREARAAWCGSGANPEAEPASVLRHCPRCGATAVDVEAAYCLKCRSCGFELFLNAAAAVAGILHDGSGRILLAERARPPAEGLLDVPGGFIDHGETAEDALRREIHEELGLVLTELSYLATVANLYEYGGYNYRTLDIYFLCRTLDLAQARPADDIRRVDLRRPEEFGAAELAFDSVRAVVGRLAREGLHISLDSRRQ